MEDFWKFFHWKIFKNPVSFSSHRPLADKEILRFLKNFCCRKFLKISKFLSKPSVLARKSQRDFLAKISQSEILPKIENFWERIEDSFPETYGFGPTEGRRNFAKQNFYKNFLRSKKFLSKIWDFAPKTYGFWSNKISDFGSEGRNLQNFDPRRTKILSNFWNRRFQIWKNFCK